LQLKSAKLLKNKDSEMKAVCIFACKISVQVPGIEIQGGSLCKNKKKSLGDILVEAGLISKEQLDKALKLQKKTGQKLGVLLVSEEL